jgi:hypothetical protein
MGDPVSSTALNLNKILTSLGQTYLSVQGVATQANITGNMVIMATAGRIGSVSITTAGNSTGMIYDANALGCTTLPLYVIPANVTGLVVVNMPCSYGLLVVPGTGNMTVAVSYATRTDLAGASF